mmetsp:Transcript_40947/g.102318  ORF Transcript_40947/g.102318 Transcript_40947/m.102318 type:complete len:225 (-) Transcript_40947:543-1217(-)
MQTADERPEPSDLVRVGCVSLSVCGVGLPVVDVEGLSSGAPHAQLQLGRRQDGDPLAGQHVLQALTQPLETLPPHTPQTGRGCQIDELFFVVIGHFDVLAVGHQIDLLAAPLTHRHLERDEALVDRALQLHLDQVLPVLVQVLVPLLHQLHLDGLLLSPCLQGLLPQQIRPPRQRQREGDGLAVDECGAEKAAQALVERQSVVVLVDVDLGQQIATATGVGLKC